MNASDLMTRVKCNIIDKNLRLPYKGGKLVVTNSNDQNFLSQLGRRTKDTTPHRKLEYRNVAAHLSHNCLNLWKFIQKLATYKENKQSYKLSNNISKRSGGREGHKKRWYCDD